MPGLSAKVFRTYNASETLQNELPKPEDLRGMTVADKVKRRTPRHSISVGNAVDS